MWNPERTCLLIFVLTTMGNRASVLCWNHGRHEGLIENILFVFHSSMVLCDLNICKWCKTKIYFCILLWFLASTIISSVVTNIYIYKYSETWEVVGWLLNTLGPRQMALISQTFSNAFSEMKICEFRLIFHWNLFLRVKLTIFQHWFR